MVNDQPYPAAIGNVWSLKLWDYCLKSQIRGPSTLQRGPPNVEQLPLQGWWCIAWGFLQLRGVCIISRRKVRLK